MIGENGRKPHLRARLDEANGQRDNGREAARALATGKRESMTHNKQTIKRLDRCLG